MVGGILFEHGHRLIASFVGFLTVILFIWIWNTEQRQWMRKLGLFALLGVIVQGVFGGITVLFYLPQLISTIHATLAQTFFCIVVSITLFTSKEWTSEQTSSTLNSFSSQHQSLARNTTLAIYVQLILGALLRHNDKVMSIFLLLHIVGAIIASYFIAHTYHKLKSISDEKKIARNTLLLYSLLWLQITVGIFSLFLKLTSQDEVNLIWNTIFATVFHVAIGASLLATSLVLTLRVRRSFIIQLGYSNETNSC